MSRRRSPRGRERDTTSNQSQRILHIVLIGAGVLFLLIGAVIAAGINLPGTGALSDTGANGGSASTPSEEQTPVPTTTEQSDTPTQRPTQTTTQSTTQTTQTTTQSTTQTTQTTTQTTQTTETSTPTPTPTQTTTEATRTAASEGGLNIVKTTDRNGNGYVSDFDLKIRADTRLADTDPGGSGNPYLTVKINGQQFGRTDVLEQRSANGVYSIGIKPSDLERYNQGQLQVSVQLMDKDPGQDEQINSWTQTVNYEPE